jgi:hypothetical protein
MQSLEPVIWKRLRTTNVIEWINKELKRRSRPVGAFPSDGPLRNYSNFGALPNYSGAKLVRLNFREVRF